MALDAADRARLKRIETGLVEADPVLAEMFRRWRPSTVPGVVRPGWTVVPGWMLVVFVFAFVMWVVGPVPSGMIAVAGCCWAVLRGVRHLRVRVRDGADRDGGGGPDDERGGRSAARGW
jgi:hypothetical protein